MSINLSAAAVTVNSNKICANFKHLTINFGIIWHEQEIKSYDLKLYDSVFRAELLTI